MFSSHSSSAYTPNHGSYDSVVISSMNSSPMGDRQHSKSPTPAAEFSDLPLTSPARMPDSADHAPMSHADESSTLISLDEESPVIGRPGQFNTEADLLQRDHYSSEQLSSTHPSSTNEIDMPDLTSSDLQLSSTLDESSLTQSLTRSLPIDCLSDKSVDMLDTVFPSRSPIDEPPTFPLTPPAYSSSQLPSDALDSSFDPTAHFSLTPEHSNSHSSSSRDVLVSSTEISVHSEMSLPSFDLCSSPPSSSPEPVFSSSPPAASDSSVFPDTHHHTVHGESDLNTHTLVDSTNSSPPSKSPPQGSSPLMVSAEMQKDSSLLNQDGFNELPPSSSPFQSSSPSPQSMELSEEPPSLELDEVDANISSNSVFSHPQSTELLGPDPPGTPLLTPNQVEKESVQISSVVPPSNPTSLGIQVSKNVISGPTDAAVDGSNDGLSLSHKRKREEEGSQQGGEAPKEIATQPPNPKRPTLASQKLQRKTLVKPFRSPAMMPKVPEPVVTPPPPKKEAISLELSSNDSDLKKLKHRTQRAAGQFKSPLPLAASSSIPSSVRQTPTIQALERKVQVLKRAVKVTNEGEEQTLEALVKKWTEAGREVAWEVWELVKDNQSGGGDDWGKDSQEARAGKRRFEDSWGWNEDSSSKRIKVEETERNWGWSISPVTAADNDEHSSEQPVESIEEDKPQETLGTMLMRLGIAPTTLGWNDDEGEFVDD
ncbi:hypothetical protein FB451DRAFT_28517 [Mycena latifolia]|nr:hypothetical protein FB451DRAFT_28517 [Mycena latifolia]